MLNLSGRRERSFYGRSCRVKADIGAQDLKGRRHKTLGYELDVPVHQFNRNHVDMLDGLARLVDPHIVEVTPGPGEVTRLTADRFLICTGTRTYRPDTVPFNGRTIIDSDVRVHP